MSYREHLRKSAKPYDRIWFGIMLLEKGLPATLTRVDILDFIHQNISPTISEISRGVGFDYKNTHRYIQEFKKHDIVKLTPNTPSRGKKVIVTLPSHPTRTRSIKITELLDGKFQEEFYLEGKDLEVFDNFMSKFVVTKIMEGDI